MAVQSAAAQVVIQETRTGERTAMSESPHRVAEDMMVRAVAMSDEQGLTWALIFYGTDGAGQVHITANKETVEPTQVTTDPEAPGGRTRVFFTESTFYQIGHATTVQIKIGDTTFNLPDEARKDIQLVHEKVR